MRERRECAGFLADINDAAEMAEQFAVGMGIEGFLADKKTSYAVVRALTIIGEAAKKTPSPVRKRYLEIPVRVPIVDWGSRLCRPLPHGLCRTSI
ncbi:MAG: HepT-like ribonuclease domain-containing protein [Candidatus Bipolaricaulota bacterium]